MTPIISTPYAPLTRGKPFVLYGLAEDRTVFQPIRDTRVWEPHVIALLERIIQPGFVCLDIGANIGAITLPLARLASKGHVYAFEASQESAGILARNVNSNDLPNVTVVHAAVGERTGDTVDLYTIPGQLGTAHQTIDQGRDGNVEQVRTLALDDYPVAHADFIKLDVEGAEIAALAGARRLFKPDVPPMVIEYNPSPAAWFARQEPDALYHVLKDLYAHLEIIGDKGALRPILRWEQLAEALNASGWCDLFCHGINTSSH